MGVIMESGKGKSKKGMVRSIVGEAKKKAWDPVRPSSDERRRGNPGDGKSFVI